MIQNLPILNKSNKNNLKTRIDLLNKIYNERYNDNFKNSLSILAKDLFFLDKKLNKLKIKGFWQNPNCYIKDLDYYRSLLIDTKILVNEEILKRKYISIHIRKGDYLSNKSLFDRYYAKFSPVKFILLSLNLIPNDSDHLPIYIISDDIEWAKNLISFLSSRTRHNFFTVDTKNHFEDWAILRHSSINICSNSTFSYTAALLNYENLDRKLRCIIPQWISEDESSYEKGWLSPKGFIEI